MEAIVGVPTFQRPQQPSITSEQPTDHAGSLVTLVSTPSTRAWFLLTPPHASIIVRTGMDQTESDKDV